MCGRRKFQSITEKLGWKIIFFRTNLFDDFDEKFVTFCKISAFFEFLSLWRRGKSENGGKNRKFAKVGKWASRSISWASREHLVSIFTTWTEHLGPFFNRIVENIRYLLKNAPRCSVQVVKMLTRCSRDAHEMLRDAHFPTLANFSIFFGAFAQFPAPQAYKFKKRSIFRKMWKTNYRFRRPKT